MDENIMYIKKLNDVFTNVFESQYRQLKKTGKTKLIKYAESIYRRWFYSALFEETILSPANLVYTLNNKCEPARFIVPTNAPLSTKVFKGFECKFNEYMLDDHLVTHDLEMIVTKAPTTMSLRQDGRVDAAQEEIFLKELSLHDPFYIQYLVAVGLELKLFEKLPAIYTHLVKVSDDCGFFKQSRRAQFEKIVDATIDISTDRLNNLLPTDKQLFDKRTVKEFLINPLTVDEIFQEVYAELGIILEEIWEMEFEELDELDNMVLSSTYILGIVIDKWFLTPFGHYLKLIRPLYTLPYKFSEELAFICDEALEKEDDIITTLYAPCSQYAVTSLGCDYFQIPENKEDEQVLTDSIPIEKIIHTIVDNIENNNMNTDSLPTEETKMIFEIKIKMIKNKSYWKVLEILSTNTLHDLHIEICKYFDLSFENKYSIFLDSKRNPFTEYTSPEKKKNAAKKSNKANIEELNLEVKQKLIYIVDTDDLRFEPLAEFVGNTGLELEILNIKNASTGVIYPRVSKISKYFKALEENPIFF